jgi:YD repeat-containing protein
MSVKEPSRQRAKVPIRQPHGNPTSSGRHLRLGVAALSIGIVLMWSSVSEAASTFYQWQLNLGNSASGTAWASGWQADPESACVAGQAAAQENPARIGFNTSGAYAFRNWSHVLVPNTYPYYGCNITAEYESTSCTTGTCWSPIQSGAFAIDPRTNTGWYFVSTRLPPSLLPAQCKICIADPINPASGAVFSAEVDVKQLAGSAIVFERFYDSTNSGGSNLSTGWRHSFDASIKPKYSSVNYLPYVPGDPESSSLYNDATSACTSGFTEIKNQVGSWQNAIASYVNGVCLLNVGTTNIGTLPVLYSSSTQFPAPLPIIVAFDVTRDDGQLITFMINGGSIVAPPGINLKPQQTSAGYTLTDENDSVETYDINGKLLSITTHNGVVQTTSYDISGRLSGVTDSFGHQLTLSYDSQNRLITVTRQ